MAAPIENLHASSLDDLDPYAVTQDVFAEYHGVGLVPDGYHIDHNGDVITEKTLSTDRTPRRIGHLALLPAPGPEELFK